jgi:hypothetical protein
MAAARTYPSKPMDGMQPNYFTINGKAYPATATISMAVGETLKVRLPARWPCAVRLDYWQGARIITLDIGAQQITAFAPPGLPQFVRSRAKWNVRM